MATMDELVEVVPVIWACEALGVARSSWYRSRQAARERPERTYASPPRALKDEEREKVVGILNDERFQDESPREVYATLLDEGVYLCSVRTMYRMLDELDQVHERRDQRQHPSYSKPELLATAPNELWSWDITKLKGPSKWLYYYLYVILDVFSRYVVGWLVTERESGAVAEQLIAESCYKQEIDPGQLTLHSDRGSAMKAKSVAQLLSDLGVTKTHSRPYTSTDNPFSEAQFRTMKYRPDYPARFGSLEDALGWARAFFYWYNNMHHHTSLGLMTPTVVHHGLAAEVTRRREATLLAAYRQHPERFVNGVPKPPRLPDKVWINPPPRSIAEEQP
jgi:putative transposase